MHGESSPLRLKLHPMDDDAGSELRDSSPMVAVGRLRGGGNVLVPEIPLSAALAATIGAIVAVSVLLLLQRDVIRIVMGLYLLWHAINLLLLSATTVRGTRSPFTLEGAGPVVDPLVQALVLTAIVISLGFSAFLLILVYWMAHQKRSADVGDFRDGRH